MVPVLSAGHRALATSGKHPQVSLTIATDGDLLAFKPAELTCTTATLVHLTLFHTGKYINQAHDWVLTVPGEADAVAQAVLVAGEAGGYMPHGDRRVIAATKMCDKGEHVTVDFIAPAPGDYPFICTYPGHAAFMRGIHARHSAREAAAKSTVFTLNMRRRMFGTSTKGEEKMATQKVSAVRIALALVGSLALAAARGAAGAEPQSPEQVHTALRILASVYADMESKLPSQQFDRIPHENMEFHEASGAMRDAMEKEPADYKAKVLAALDKAVNDSQNVADTSKTHDAAKVRAALDVLIVSMRSLNGLFPETLRAEPGSVPAPQHNGPPPSH
jgi:azurin